MSRTLRKTGDRPNMLFILTDDQGYWALTCAGNREIETPALDSLAGQGILFSNFFCTSPVCSPARASILTGQIPSQHGVHDWICAGNSEADTVGDGRLVEYLEGREGYTDVLARNGYVCGISGKWHLGDSHHAQKSFGFWEVHATGGGPYYNAPMIRDGQLHEEPRYVTDAITDNALRFLETVRNGSDPFYLSVHYTAPHSPWQREHHPKDLFDAYYENCPFDSVPNGLPVPSWVRHRNIPVDDPATRRVYLSGYYAAVTAMDRNVARLLEWLDENGLRNNTLVVFSSDNGMNMGHHGIYGKGNATLPLNMYDTSVKVPTIISHPGNIPHKMICNDLLSHYDIMPTLLDYVGLENPAAESLPGRSFAALLQRGTTEGRENVVVYDEYGPVRMIRNREWKYIYRYPNGPHELYKLTDDPEEQDNLVDSSGHREKIAELKGELETWFSRYVEPEMDGVRQPVSGRGQYGRRAWRARDGRLQ